MGDKMTIAPTEDLLLTIQTLQRDLKYARQQKSLRDEFAMAVLPTVLSRIFADKQAVESGRLRPEVPPFIAEECYKLADAMLVERKRTA